MDSSPDLSMKLRRGSSDSRDSFYMGFTQGIDSDIEEVTTSQNFPTPPLFPAPEEPPIDLPPLIVEEDESFVARSEQQVAVVVEENKKAVLYVQEEQTQADEERHKEEANKEAQKTTEHSEPMQKVDEVIIVEEIPPPLPSSFIPTSSVQVDDDEDESNTSVTVIPIKSKPPSSSSSSISSAENELIIDDQTKTQSSEISLRIVSSPPPPARSSPPQQKQQARVAFSPSTPPPRIHENDFGMSKSPPSKKSSRSSSQASLSHKSPASQKSLAKSPPRHLDFNRNELRQRQQDSDSIDSINAIDCNIDDDNRDDSSPTDSMPPIPTPPPLEPLTLLEKSGIMEATSEILVPSPSSPDNVLVSPETLSNHSQSPTKSSRVLTYAQHVTHIDETSRLPSSLRSSQTHLMPNSNSHRSTPSSPPPPFQSGPMTPAESSQAIVTFKHSSPLPPANTTTSQHLAVLYQTHHHLHPILTSPVRRPSRLPDTSRFLMQQQYAIGIASSQREINASDAFCTTLSALYGKILVVMGIAFPMAEVISTYIPPSFYEGFYLYLYIGSMLFLLFMYATLLWGNKPVIPIIKSLSERKST